MAGYTRQSSFTDGDVITASHSNDEFNQILAAFVNTSGHKHDGTAAEGPVIGLIGDPGVATPLNKVVVDNTNNRVGVFVDAGGAGSTARNVIAFITITTLGNATDFGDLAVGGGWVGGGASSTRGVFAGGYHGGGLNRIEYVTIATTGDATDFGDLVGPAVYGCAGLTDVHGGLG